MWLTGEMGLARRAVGAEDAREAAAQQQAETQRQWVASQSAERDGKRRADIAFCQAKAEALVWSMLDAQQARLRAGTFADIPEVLAAEREARMAYAAATAAVLVTADPSVRNSWRVERVIMAHPLSGALPWLETLAAALTPRPER